MNIVTLENTTAGNLVINEQVSAALTVVSLQPGETMDVDLDFISSTSYVYTLMALGQLIRVLGPQPGTPPPPPPPDLTTLNSEVNAISTELTGARAPYQALNMRLGTFVDLTSAQSISGVKSFASAVLSPGLQFGGAILSTTGNSTFLQPASAAQPFTVLNAAGTIANFSVSDLGNATFVGAVSATSFWGDGSHLSNLSFSQFGTGVIPVSGGGTGTATPAMVAGPNISLTGTFPNYTVSASGVVTGISAASGNSNVIVGGTSSNPTIAVVSAPTFTGPVSAASFYGSGIGLSPASIPNSALVAPPLTGLLQGQNISVGTGTQPIVSFTGVLPSSAGGTGTNNPAIVAGSGITITGTFPNYTITNSYSVTGNSGFVDTTTNQSVSGNKTFVNPITAGTLNAAGTAQLRLNWSSGSGGVAFGNGANYGSGAWVDIAGVYHANNSSYGPTSATIVGPVNANGTVTSGGTYTVVANRNLNLVSSSAAGGGMVTVNYAAGTNQSGGLLVYDGGSANYTQVSPTGIAFSGSSTFIGLSSSIFSGYTQITGVAPSLLRLYNSAGGGADLTFQIADSTTSNPGYLVLNNNVASSQPLKLNLTTGDLTVTGSITSVGYTVNGNAAINGNLTLTGNILLNGANINGANTASTSTGAVPSPNLSLYNSAGNAYGALLWGDGSKLTTALFAPYNSDGVAFLTYSGGTYPTTQSGFTKVAGIDPGGNAVFNGYLKLGNSYAANPGDLGITGNLYFGNTTTALTASGGVYQLTGQGLTLPAMGANLTLTASGSGSSLITHPSNKLIFQDAVRNNVKLMASLKLDSYTGNLFSDTAITAPGFQINNLVADPGFEQGSTFWSFVNGAGISIVAGPGNAGNLLSYTGTGSPTGYLYVSSAAITTVPGTVYVFSATTNATSVSAGAITWGIYSVGAGTTYTTISWAAGQNSTQSVQWTCPAGVTQVEIDADTSNATVLVGQAITFSAPSLVPTWVVNSTITATGFIGDGSGLKNVTLQSAGIAPGSITTAMIANAAVTSPLIASNAVGTTQLAGSAVTMPKIAYGSVGTNQLAASAVTSTNIANGAVGVAQMDPSIFTSNLAASAGYFVLGSVTHAFGSVSSVLIDGSATSHVTFPAGSFSAVPISVTAVIMSSTQSYDLTLQILNITQTGFDVYVAGAPVGQGYTCAVMYQADGAH